MASVPSMCAPRSDSGSVLPLPSGRVRDLLLVGRRSDPWTGWCSSLPPVMPPYSLTPIDFADLEVVGAVELGHRMPMSGLGQGEAEARAARLIRSAVLMSARMTASPLCTACPPSPGCRGRQRDDVDEVLELVLGLAVAVEVVGVGDAAGGLGQLERVGRELVRGPCDLAGVQATTGVAISGGGGGGGGSSPPQPAPASQKKPTGGAQEHAVN